MKDPLLADYTIEELQIEYFMDLIERDPQEALPRVSDAKVQFRTGDPLIDKWEEQLAKGEEVNFDEGVDPKFLKRFKEYSRRVASGNPSPGSDVITATADAPSHKIDVSADEEAFLNLVGFEEDFSAKK